MPKKLYIVRKYIWARNAKEALTKEGRSAPDDVWVDDDWKKDHQTQLEKAIGFIVKKEKEEE